MRYNTLIYFQSIITGEYERETGNYADDTTKEVKRYAAVTDTGTDTLQLVYGGLKQGSLTIRLQQAYVDAFDRIRIGAKCYRVDKSRLCKRVFIVSEVQ